MNTKQTHTNTSGIDINFGTGRQILNNIHCRSIYNKWPFQVQAKTKVKAELFDETWINNKSAIQAEPSVYILVLLKLKISSFMHKSGSLFMLRLKLIWDTFHFHLEFFLYLASVLIRWRCLSTNFSFQFSPEFIQFSISSVI